MSPGKSVTVRSGNRAGPVPDILRTHFVYVQPPTNYSTTFANVVYEQNDLGDPYASGSGNPVDYYYPFSQLYQNYMVHSSSIEVFCDNTNAATEETYVFVYPVVSAGAGTLPTSMDQALVFPNAKWVVVGPDQSSIGHKTLQHYCEVGALEGIANISDDPAFEGTFAGPPFSSPGPGPATTHSWIIYVVNSAPGTNIDITLTVKLKYYCALYNVRPDSANTLDSSKSVPPFSPKAEVTAPGALSLMEESIYIKVPRKSVKA